MLTFDDGYSSHYNNVFPILKQKVFKDFFLRREQLKIVNLLIKIKLKFY